MDRIGRSWVGDSDMNTWPGDDRDERFERYAAEDDDLLKRVRAWRAEQDRIAVERENA